MSEIGAEENLIQLQYCTRGLNNKLPQVNNSKFEAGTYKGSDKCQRSTSRSISLYYHSSSTELTTSLTQKL